jgi:peptidoglycan/xylan/chitin deacetylase (PgdA/CDA1 family)
MINGQEKPGESANRLTYQQAPAPPTAVNVPLRSGIGTVPAGGQADSGNRNGQVPVRGMDNPQATLWAAALSAAVGVAGALAATAPVRAEDCPGRPDAIGTSRILAIDPADYPRLGTMQYAQTLPLNDHEVVLTFDDGPLPPHSTAVLNALAAQCVKATFFLVGAMARAFPDTVRRVHADGHTIGTHSENHPLHFRFLPPDRLRHEIEAGIANVIAAVGDPEAVAPFFRIPGLDRSDAVEDALAAHSLATFSADTLADDWHRRITPSQIVARAMSRLEAKGKGILLLHDIHPWTAAALPGLFKELKDHGFHIVQVVPSSTATPQIMLAARSEWTVAWSMAGQDVMDDSGSAPAWPKLADSAISEAADLPAPDEGTFDPHYALSRFASRADIEVDSPSVEAGIAATPWPYQVFVALPASRAQLPAPSVWDIGWPVTERQASAASVEPRPNVEPTVVERTQPSRSEPRQVRLTSHRHAHAHARPTEQHAELLSPYAAMATPAH